MRPALYALLALLISLTVAPTAAAWTTIDDIANPQTVKLYRDWQAAAQVPTPHTTVGYAEEGALCGEGGMACILRTPQRLTLVFPDALWLWADDGPSRPRDRMMYRALFYHELGHIRDVQPRKTRRYRDRFVQIMGWRPLSSLTPRERRSYEEHVIPGIYEGWDSCVYTPDKRNCVAPNETFAMAYEWCALNARNRTLDEWASGYAYAPTLAQHRAACHLLAGNLS